MFLLRGTDTKPDLADRFALLIQEMRRIRAAEAPVYGIAGLVGLVVFEMIMCFMGLFASLAAQVDAGTFRDGPPARSRDASLCPEVVQPGSCAGAERSVTAERAAVALETRPIVLDVAVAGNDDADRGDAGVVDPVVAVPDADGCVASWCVSRVLTFDWKTRGNDAGSSVKMGLRWWGGRLSISFRISNDVRMLPRFMATMYRSRPLPPAPSRKGRGRRTLAADGE